MSERKKQTAIGVGLVALVVVSVSVFVASLAQRATRAQSQQTAQGGPADQGAAKGTPGATNTPYHTRRGITDLTPGSFVGQIAFTVKTESWHGDVAFTGLQDDDRADRVRVMVYVADDARRENPLVTWLSPVTAVQEGLTPARIEVLIPDVPPGDYTVTIEIVSDARGYHGLTRKVTVQ